MEKTDLEEPRNNPKDIEINIKLKSLDLIKIENEEDWNAGLLKHGKYYYMYEAAINYKDHPDSSDAERYFQIELLKIDAEYKYKVVDHNIHIYDKNYKTLRII